MSIDVNGKNQHPLYQWLTSKTTNPKTAGRIKWNFTKFLIDRNGNIVDRFGSMTKPSSKKLIQAIETALAQTTTSTN